MNPGSAVPTDPVDSIKAQAIYDAVVQGVGCAGKADTLQCLRKAEYQVSHWHRTALLFGRQLGIPIVPKGSSDTAIPKKLLTSMNSVPAILSFNALALSYLPRPDGKFLVSSPEDFAASGQLTQIPFIIGDQKDEDTLFGLFTSNISTSDDFKDYLKTLYFTNTNPQIVDQFVGIYPEDPAQGSPLRHGRPKRHLPAVQARVRPPRRRRLRDVAPRRAQHHGGAPARRQALVVPEPV